MEGLTRIEAIVSEFAIILLLVLTKGLFAGAELALISLRKTRLQELMEQGSGAARTAAAFGGVFIAQRLASPLTQLGLSPERRACTWRTAPFQGSSFFGLVFLEKASGVVKGNQVLRTRDACIFVLGVACVLVQRNT